MATFEPFAEVIARQENSSAPPSCAIGNEYDGRVGLRVAALFIIWITSSLGAALPIWARRKSGLSVPDWVFFVCKHFGGGVIVATAWIHLLAPAEDALRNPCLTGVITEYPWVEAIVLLTIFSLLRMELLVRRYGNFGGGGGGHHDLDDAQPHVLEASASAEPETSRNAPSDKVEPPEVTQTALRRESQSSQAPRENQPAHVRDHNDIECAPSPVTFEDYKAQMTALFILEFGVIFHSVFIGLTLAVAGKEFNTLFIVIIFHQMFEGLGLGSRLAVTPWPENCRWTPYMLALGYGLSTPIAVAIGLGVRKSYPPGAQTTLIVNGIFDSVSAGVLIYTGLVELIAHEFLFSSTMRKAKAWTVEAAFLTMCLGALMMALLGRWA
ncbi:low-affinity Zn(2+) transporter zrt2 [Elasticomyces elasticus]|uniref:Low-affinity Zn(2+) transporter zrt2 n=1 Tax=Exophiala sideris TaxID=1016849 RepID=A0ABR0J2A0_9EURO|nr:low-affinity Zn(2+) transporter zrt2 [Elasticomyces elasticus]KAK5024135.1 low-affinity Zn(2+) transporter zrt2 [Exophiala sideris]KAK5029005.1 low-affinity Zn(2+) transporter zrt2 [Exophiala sideris]KAK5054847.1 low-affinity Zn(2+) transporter zrt2 [Exophiala sideris]KAK5178828.1 low-affinity Zn(2+) transporter zrt2 [Eurotiomycetes sp. CCFEE 6388]